LKFFHAQREGFPDPLPAEHRYNVSVLHQDEGGIEKSIPDARKISRGSREIRRAEGMDFPIPPEFWWSTDNLSASIFLQGVDQKILPCGQGRIDSV